jgi:hypothetical protein
MVAARGPPIQSGVELAVTFLQAAANATPLNVALPVGRPVSGRTVDCPEVTLKLSVTDLAEFAAEIWMHDTLAGTMAMANEARPVGSESPLSACETQAANAKPETRRMRRTMKGLPGTAS